MPWFEANYTIQVLESQIPLLLIYENNSAVNVWTPCCWILSNCGGVVPTGLLVIALVQELVSLVAEFAGSCTVENVARRAHPNGAPSENASCFQSTSCEIIRENLALFRESF